MTGGHEPGASAASIEAQLFDGRRAAARRVRLRVDGAELVAEGEGQEQRWPLDTVTWPERTRHGRRVVLLASGETLQCDDGPAFDAWVLSVGRRESAVVRAQQTWRAALYAVAGLVLLVVAGYLWGVPWAARGIVALVPAEVEAAIGRTALRSIDDRWLEPSALPAPRQAALREAFAQAARTAYRDRPGELPEYRLEFRRAHKAIGANAFALPGGTIVVTDAMVELLKDRDDVLLGVFAHELGHVRARHGMRGLVQATLVGAAVSAVIGDFSTLLAGVPAILAQMSYSRDLEREADHESARVLRAAGHAPAVMVVFFERVRGAERGGALPIAIASHPDHEERMRYFRETAQR